MSGGSHENRPKVTVLILNYNGAKFIRACLDSVVKQTYRPLEVILIDNKSGDDSASIAAAEYPQVRLLANPENYGFARAMNIGIDASEGEFVLTLNVDVVLRPDYVSRVLAAALKDERIGSISGKILRPADGARAVLDSTGHVIFKNRLFRDRGEGQIDRGQFDRPEEIFGACAGIGFYRRAMLADIKVGSEYFDSDFFLFLEDTDLSWRAQLRGWKCLYLPAAVAYHHRGGVAKRRTKLVELHNYKNRYFMLLKNDAAFSFIKYLPHFLITDTLKGVGLLWRCPPALLGWGEVIKKFPTMLRKRRYIQKHRLVSQRELEKKWFMPFNYREWFGKHIRGL